MTNPEQTRASLERFWELVGKYHSDESAHVLDRIKHVPKRKLYEASYEAVASDLPKSVEAFTSLPADAQPTTLGGEALLAFVHGPGKEHFEVSPFEFARIFISGALNHVLGPVHPNALKFHLYMDAHFETDEPVGAALRSILALWVLDPRMRTSPQNAPASEYSDLDSQSIWAFWTRKLTHPIHIDRPNGRRERLGTGYVYDLRTMAGFQRSTADLRALTRSILQEADILRTGSIPPGAFVEINFPPFTFLAFEELTPGFVMMEALDQAGRVLPIYYFPSAQKWVVPSTGCGPDGRAAGFDDVTAILALMGASALRDFWIIEERQRVLGPPRVMSTPTRSGKVERRVVYLPRIRYVGGRDLVAQAERSGSFVARAAHWRSEHYRKLPAGQSVSVKQLTLASEFKKRPPEGHTWVRGSSVAGADVERVYRSRSISQALFDVIPSKGKALTELNWLEFELHCTGWLSKAGFDEVARASVDRGVDIVGFKGSTPPVKWVIQCKHWEAKIGPDVVRELEGARRLRGADRAMLMISSAFTPAAIETACELGIELVDGDQIMGHAR